MKKEFLSDLVRKREERFKELQFKINILKFNSIEMEYLANLKNNRSFFQRFYYRFPFFYILFCMKNKGLKNTLVNIKGYYSIKKNQLFDFVYYLKNNKDVRSSGMDPLLHYIYYGFNEGRDPSPSFSTKFYLEEYDYIKESNINPLIHYTLYGKKEGKTPIETKKTRGIKKSLNTDNIIDSHSKAKILYVVHQGEGGTQYTNEDLMKGVQNYLDCYLLSSNARSVVLFRYVNNRFEEISSWSIKSKWSAKDFYNSEFRNIYHIVLTKFSIDVVHIRHLMLHTFDLFDVAEKLMVPLILSFHDFYFICPSFTLLDENNNYCEGKCTEGSGQCNYLMSILKDLPNLKKFVNTWRNEVSNAFKKSSAFVTTSEKVKEVFISVYPELSQREFRVIEHGRDFKTFENSKLYEVPSKNKIKILIPGDIKVHKGADLIKEIKKLDKNSRVEFHFLGVLQNNLKPYGIYHGPYKRNDFCKLVQKIKPSFIGIFSIWPETYCHTLSEAWSCGIPVLATKIGALEERVIKNGGGWLLDYKNPQNAYNEIIKIADSTEEYVKVAEEVKDITFKSTDKMAQEYLELYYQFLLKK